MRTYELVCVIDTTLSSSGITDLQGRVEKHLVDHKGEIKATDQIGLVPMAYPLNGQDQGYIVSYHISIDPDALPELRTEMGLEKGLAKFFFYGMKDSDEFLVFSELQKRYDEIYPVVEEEEEESEEEPRKVEELQEEDAE